MSPPQERMPRKAPTRDFPVASLRPGGGGHAGTDVREGADRQRWGDASGRNRRARSSVIGSCRPAMVGWAAFCAASWHQKARDEFVGWSADVRVANLQLMVNRFLLLPGVRVHELASRVLDLAVTRLPGDREAAYGVRPACTYVSPDQPCYRAAGWERCGRPTSGLRRRGERRRAVGEAVGRRLERAAAPGTGRSASLRKRLRWGEYGRGRTRHRMAGRAWEARPGEPVPVPGQGRSGLPAAVEPESAPRYPTRNAWRCRRERVVLAGHDDAELQRAPRLVPLGGGGSGTKGIAAHFGLATARRPLGVFEATMRDDKGESVRWPLRQDAGNRARLSRHAGRHRAGG